MALRLWECAKDPLGSCQSVHHIWLRQSLLCSSKTSVEVSERERDSMQEAKLKIHVFSTRHKATGQTEIGHLDFLY